MQFPFWFLLLLAPMPFTVESIDIGELHGQLLAAERMVRNVRVDGMSIVEEMYQQFVDVVDQGRPSLDRKEVLALANGSIYSAQQALTNGLVDEIGSEEVAFAYIKQALEEERMTVVEQRRRPGLAEILFGIRGPRPPSLEQIAAQALVQNTGSRLLYYWPGGR